MIVQKLNSLGFANAANLGEKNGKTLVRVRTARGWVYERFSSTAEIAAWAQKHEPEVTE